MGLMYVFPVSEEETDFVKLELSPTGKGSKITLKSYGLPYIFWGYALGAMMMVAFMFLAVREPILKLISLGDEVDVLLGYSLFGFLALIPICTFAFFFYEKRIIKEGTQIKMIYRLYGIPVFTETFQLNDHADFSVEHFMDSPNVARMKGGEEAAGFQNKGYFILWMKTADGKKIILDRHSRKADVDKLLALLKLV